MDKSTHHKFRPSEHPFLTVLLCVLFFPQRMQAQFQQIFDKSVKTLTVAVDGDPTKAPFLAHGKHQHLTIEWDQMSHNYIRYIYHIEHCDADWNPSEQIFESDFLAGMNGQVIEDYEKSFNTSQIYTHYRLVLPNADVSMLLSGNYRMRIFHEGEAPENAMPVLEVRFMVYEQAAGISTAVSSNTDIDFNQSHQQVSLKVGYGSLSVSDPARELRVMVLKNRLWNTRVDSLIPNMRNQHGIEFNHQRRLIFPAGNEFHRFEIQDIRRSTMGVDRTEWIEPFYHATLFPHRRENSYSYTEDQNGVFVVRSNDDMDDATTAEYLLVHFIFQSPRIPGHDVYISGLWTGLVLSPEYRMEYLEEENAYHAALFLKQGYYSFQYVTEDGATQYTMGDFYETENEYTTLVYFRQTGARYDRLVALQQVRTNPN